MRAEISRDSFEGFVLAGGRSSRMGTDKAFLKLENQTFVERACGALAPACRGRVKVVLNADQPAADFSSFDCLRDIFAGRGAAGGIHAALSNSKSEWAIVLACDLPLVTGEFIRNLSETALNLPARFAALVPRQPGGKTQPLCALYRPKLCLPQLTKLLQTEASVSVRHFLSLTAAFYIDLDQVPAADESVLFNVNQPEDFEFVSEKQPR